MIISLVRFVILDFNSSISRRKSSSSRRGMGIGFVCERRWVGFEPHRSWSRRALGLLIGLVVLIGLWYGLSIAFEPLSPPLLLRFVRYGLVGLWGAVGAPWVFVQLGLSKTQGGD